MLPHEYLHFPSPRVLPTSDVPVTLAPDMEFSGAYQPDQSESRCFWLLPQPLQACFSRSGVPQDSALATLYRLPPDFAWSCLAIIISISIGFLAGMVEGADGKAEGRGRPGDAAVPAVPPIPT